METAIQNHRIIRCLRKGSAAESFLAVDPSGQKIVLTYLRAERLKERMTIIAHNEGMPIEELDEEAERRFRKYEDEFKEAVLRVKGLSGDHVAEIYGTGFDQEKKQLVVVSEYVPGVDFFYATRGLSPLQMISLFVQALDGMSFIHKSGYLHLNVKPTRIRVDVEGIPPVVKFTDFGFAIPKGGYPGEYRGTVLYMAPEVILDRRELIDERADLYSFGVTAYYCLTGRHPTEHRVEAQADRKRLANMVAREAIFPPPSHYDKKVPAEMDEIILRLLEKEPHSRPPNANKVLDLFCEKWPDESKEMPHELTSTEIFR